MQELVAGLHAGTTTPPTCRSSKTLASTRNRNFKRPPKAGGRGSKREIMSTPSTEPGMNAAVDEVRSAAEELRGLGETVRRYETASKRFDLLGGSLEQASVALTRAQSGFEAFVSETRAARRDIDGTLRQVNEVIAELREAALRLASLDLARLTERIAELQAEGRADRAARARDDSESRKVLERLSDELASSGRQSITRDEDLLRRIGSQSEVIESLKRQIRGRRGSAPLRPSHGELGPTACAITGAGGYELSDRRPEAMAMAMAMAMKDAARVLWGAGSGGAAGCGPAGPSRPGRSPRGPPAP